MNKQDLIKALKALGIVTYSSKYGSYFLIGKYLFSNAHVFENAEEMKELEPLHKWSLTATKFFRPVSKSVPDIAVAELENSNKAPAFNFFDTWRHDQECYCYINPMVDSEHEDWLTILEDKPINTARNPVIFKCPNEKMPLGLSGAPLLHVKRKTPDGDKPFFQIKPAGVIYAKDEINEHLYAVSLKEEMAEITNLLQKRDEDDRKEESHTYQPTLPQKASALEPALNAYNLGHLSNKATFSPIATGLTLLRKPKLTNTKLAILNDSVRIEDNLSDLKDLETSLTKLLTRLLASFADSPRSTSEFLEKVDQTNEMRIDFEPGPKMLCFEDNLPDHDHEKSSRFLAIKFDSSIQTVQKESVLKALFYSALFLQTVVISLEQPYSLEKENKSSTPQKDAKKHQQQKKREKKAANKALKEEDKRTAKTHFEIFMHPNGNLHLDALKYNRYHKIETNTDHQTNPSIQVITSLFQNKKNIQQDKAKQFLTMIDTLIS